MSAHYLLASVVPDEKSAQNLIEDPLYVTNCIGLDTLKILFIFGFEVYVLVWASLSSSCDSLNFFDVYIDIFHEIWDSLAIILDERIL